MPLSEGPHMLRLMTDVEAIESYALHSGFTMPAILELRPKLGRIARQMHERAVTRIPLRGRPRTGRLAGYRGSRPGTHASACARCPVLHAAVAIARPRATNDHVGHQARLRPLPRHRHRTPHHPSGRSPAAGTDTDAPAAQPPILSMSVTEIDASGLVVPRGSIASRHPAGRRQQPGEGQGAGLVRRAEQSDLDLQFPDRHRARARG